MGNNLGWSHFLVRWLKNRKKTFINQQQNSRWCPTCLRLKGRKAAQRYTSSQILCIRHLKPNLWFKRNSPFIYLLKAPTWTNRSCPATPRQAGSIRGGVRGKRGEIPAPASAHSAPRAPSQGSRCAEERGKSWSVSRHQRGKRFRYLHCRRTEKSQSRLRARPWNKADPWNKSLLPLNTCMQLGACNESTGLRDLTVAICEHGQKYLQNCGLWEWKFSSTAVCNKKLLLWLVLNSIPVSW